MAYKKSCSIERKVESYLRPKIYQMFIADATNKMRSNSSHADDIITKHYEGLTLSAQEALLTEYKRLNK